MASQRPGHFTRRAFWLLIGFAALVVAVIGVVLPLVPTTPFVILAAFAFMNSSERLHAWLINHRVFGPMILDWRRHGAISRPAKTVAIASMAAIFVLSIVFQAPLWVLAVQAPILAVCAWFVGSRPLPPG